MKCMKLFFFKIAKQYLKKNKIIINKPSYKIIYYFVSVVTNLGRGKIFQNFLKIQYDN